MVVVTASVLWAKRETKTTELETLKAHDESAKGKFQRSKNGNACESLKQNLPAAGVLIGVVRCACVCVGCGAMAAGIFGLT